MRSLKCSSRVILIVITNSHGHEERWVRMLARVSQITNELVQRTCARSCHGQNDSLLINAHIGQQLNYDIETIQQLNLYGAEIWVEKFVRNSSTSAMFKVVWSSTLLSCQESRRWHSPWIIKRSIGLLLLHTLPGWAMFNNSMAAGNVEWVVIN